MIAKILFRLQKLLWKISSSPNARRTIRARGLRFTLQNDNWITHFRARTFNTKEPETLDWVDQWMRDGDTFLDIGANTGLYSVYAAMRHPNVRVIAIEPEYANLHLLRDNVVANRLTKRVKLFSIALHRRAGIGYLNVQDHTPGAALHTVAESSVDETRTGRPVIAQQGVYMLTLDQFCNQLGVQPNCIKIDVDGTEIEILEGAVETLSSPKLRTLIIELPEEEEARKASMQTLSDLGLKRTWQDKGGKSPNEIWSRASKVQSDMLEAARERMS